MRAHCLMAAWHDAPPLACCSLLPLPPSLPGYAVTVSGVFMYSETKRRSKATKAHTEAPPKAREGSPDKGQGGDGSRKEAYFRPQNSGPQNV